MAKKRILTGDNPTGELHVGHYVGSLQNRAALQDEYETFIVIADMHAFSYPKYVADPGVVSESVRQVLLGNLAAGLDPQKATFFVESGIPELYELATIFSMLVSHNRALRNPTLKEEIKEKNLGDSFSLGFVNFPILQVADILCVKAHLVPVGEDQLPHIELTREVARKFNSTYGEVFPEPEGKVGKIERLVGLDGNSKMTKSLDNTINLNESEGELKRKIMSMYTDPKRIHATDPGTVKGNPVFVYHDAFNPNKEEVKELKEKYEKGEVGDVEVKEKLHQAMSEFLKPIRQRYEEYEKDPSKVEEILAAGTAKTRKIVQETLRETKEKMSFL
jgi:tryptophanyl-tRNA synthetase